MTTGQHWVPWRVATERALYGPAGFYRRHRPAAHFRTSVHVSPLLARAVLALARTAEVSTVVDVGAGGGELLTVLHELAPDLTLVGVDLVDRPAGLPAPVSWCCEPPGRVEGLVVAHELLDNVPVDVARRTPDGWRTVLVATATGVERTGGRVAGADLDWLHAWWPAAQVGDRAEIGRPRDQMWAGLVGRLERGVALAVDYGHRRARRPRAGSLSAFRGGRQVRPVPDGSCDLTSHVALDACAAAGVRAGATATLLTTQRLALAALDVGAERPAYRTARSDPAAYVRALATRGELAELTDPAGLGGFGWLVQAVRVELPAGLRGLQQPTGTES